jgi:hypothetical protein
MMKVKEQFNKKTKTMIHECLLKYVSEMSF